MRLLSNTSCASSKACLASRIVRPFSSMTILSASDKGTSVSSVITIFIFLFASALASTPAFAVDLNAPATKRVTIGSEIERGQSAIINQAMSNIGDSLPQFDESLLDALTQEKQKNTDTDGFYLGAYYEMWLQMKTAVENPGVASEDEIKAANDSATTYFREFRRRQKQMQIDDATFYKALSIDAAPGGPSFEQTEAMLREWDSKVGLTH